MVKRGAEEASDGNTAYLKRQKISTSANATSTVTEDIRSGRQLRQTLAFDQDVGRARHGMSPK